MSTREQLDAIVRTVEKRGVPALTRHQLHAMPGLYRRLVSELAEARARQAPRGKLAALEALVVRTHAVLYTPAPASLGVSLIEAVTSFPRAVRAARRPILLAVALTCVGAVWGYVEARRAPENAYMLLPGGLESNAEESFQDKKMGPGSPLKGAFYFTHNATVALHAFSSGVTFGVGTVVALVINGVVLGATFAVVAKLASLSALVAFVLPHSGIELAAIFIAAAGGLRLADALLRPGWSTRRHALAQAAREALPLAVGAAGMLAVAGLIEGWISPMAWPLWGKAAFGAGVDVALGCYLMSGR